MDLGGETPNYKEWCIITLYDLIRTRDESYWLYKATHLFVTRKTLYDLYLNQEPLCYETILSGQVTHWKDAS